MANQDGASSKQIETNELLSTLVDIRASASKEYEANLGASYDNQIKSIRNKTYPNIKLPNDLDTEQNALLNQQNQQILEIIQQKVTEFEYSQQQNKQTKEKLHKSVETLKKVLEIESMIEKCENDF